MTRSFGNQSSNTMIRIPIKPLSVNEAYRGRRFASAKLKQFKKDIWGFIPNYNGYVLRKIGVRYTFGVSSKNSDGDNCIKAFQDILAEKWRFNDKQIYEWYVKKVLVKKGEEFIDFEVYDTETI